LAFLDNRFARGTELIAKGDNHFRLQREKTFVDIGEIETRGVRISKNKTLRVAPLPN
jgi:hypothetical protein